MSGKARAAAALALVMAAAAWLHARALSAGFFADDYLFLDRAHGRSLLAALTGPDPLGNYFRPVSRQAWFWALSRAAESPAAFHAANLALLLLIVALLYGVARRLLPAHAAVAAAAVVALHHAADVPVLWASGSQELLAVAGSLAAIALFAAGRRGGAAVALALALLSKESVAFAPLVAVAVARRPRESWRAALIRGWPLFATLGAWAALWIANAGRGPAIGHELAIRPASVPAAMVHLLQTAVGLEWAPGDLAGAWRARPPFAALVALAGIAWAAWAPKVARSASAEAARRQALAAGGLWALLGAVPVIAAADIWSAYYYLFALCGVALALGALVARLPAWTALVPALLIGTLSEGARRLPEFASERSPWTTLSHLNRRYLERGMAVSGRLLADLRAARPTLPPSSTVYFAGVPAAVAFQAADGPLLRWAYRDSSLRSRFLTDFRVEQARRGPVLFFQMSQGKLIEVAGPDSLEHVGLGLVLSDAPEPAEQVLALAFERRRSGETAYRAAWAALAHGDTAATLGWLVRAGVAAAPGPTPEIAAALERVAAGDTAGAIARMLAGVAGHGLDPGAHALMADLWLSTGQLDLGTIEALAARALAPEEPSVWRRWGMAEAAQGATGPAARALERYRELGGAAAAGDAEAEAVLRELRRKLPGGDLVREEMRRQER